MLLILTLLKTELFDPDNDKLAVEGEADADEEECVVEEAGPEKVE